MVEEVEVFTDLMYQQYGESQDERLVNYIIRIRDAAHRQMTLIDDLLQFSRIDNEDEEIQLTDLNGVISAVIQDLEPIVREKNAKVSVDKLPTIRVRPTQLRQLFQNLIGNALKFNNKSVPEIKITNVRVPPKEPGEQLFCKIKVSDNGIGFSNEYKERIFEIFQRLHQRTEYIGSGIGLAICKRIVESHGGTIQAFGYEGKGATFEITLPC